MPAVYMVIVEEHTCSCRWRVEKESSIVLMALSFWALVLVWFLMIVLCAFSCLSCSSVLRKRSAAHACALARIKPAPSAFMTARKVHWTHTLIAEAMLRHLSCTPIVSRPSEHYVTTQCPANDSSQCRACCLSTLWSYIRTSV